MSASTLFIEERVYSDTWWKMKTGWTDSQYTDRKNALLKRLREKWPDPQDLQPGTRSICQIINSISSLVITFNDEDWCLPVTRSRTTRLAEQLRLYTKWADVINEERKNLPEDQFFTVRSKAEVVPAPSVVMETSSLDESTTRQLSINKPDLTTVVATKEKALPVSKDQFDWDDVEMYLQYPSLGSTCILHIPMPDLKPGKIGEPCNWCDFRLQKLVNYVKEEAGISINLQENALFWINGKEWTSIKTCGDFRIMLKRFAEKLNTKGTIDLILDLKSSGDSPGAGLTANPRSLKRKAAPE